MDWFPLCDRQGVLLNPQEDWQAFNKLGVIQFNTRQDNLQGHKLIGYDLQILLLQSVKSAWRLFMWYEMNKEYTTLPVDVKMCVRV